MGNYIRVHVQLLGLVVRGTIESTEYRPLDRALYYAYAICACVRIITRHNYLPFEVHKA